MSFIERLLIQSLFLMGQPSLPSTSGRVPYDQSSDQFFSFLVIFLSFFHKELEKKFKKIFGEIQIFFKENFGEAGKKFKKNWRDRKKLTRKKMKRESFMK